MGQDGQGTVKVTCPEALGPRLMGSRLIDKFNARYPGLRVEFVMSDKVLNLAKGEADIAFRAITSVDGALVGRKSRIRLGPSTPVSLMSIAMAASSAKRT